MGKSFKFRKYDWQSRLGDLLFVKPDTKAAYLKIPVLATTFCSKIWNNNCIYLLYTRLHAITTTRFQFLRVSIFQHS